MDKLKEYIINVDLIATDRHCGMKAVMSIPTLTMSLFCQKPSRTNFSPKVRPSRVRSSHAWIQAVFNHLWWSTDTCDKDPEVLVEKLLLVVYHTANIHS